MCVQIHTINIPICILQGMIIVAAVVLILKFQNTCELGEAHMQVRRFEVRSTHGLDSPLCLYSSPVKINSSATISTPYALISLLV